MFSVDKAQSVTKQASHVMWK